MACLNRVELIGNVGKDPDDPTFPNARRFEAKVEMGDGCWEWRGCRDPKGYGRIGAGPRGNHKAWWAHRVSFALYNGPIPDGMMVCHRCDNKGCVNPAHLFLGDAKDNAQDAVEKGILPKGERRGNVKLTESNVAEIRRRYAGGGIFQWELAAEYGVSQTLIHHVVVGKTWKHIGGIDGKFE